jgi:hypothetical protein
MKLCSRVYLDSAINVLRVLTSQDVILIILVGLAADFDKAGQSIILHEFVHQILVLLQNSNSR